MILPIWARLDWSWLTSFTCLGPCLGNGSDSALVHVVFYLPSGCSGLFPRHLAVLQEKEGKHTRSPEARVLAQTQLFYCLPSAKESHRPSPDSRFGEMDLSHYWRGEISCCKRKGQEWWLCLQPAPETSNPSKQKCFSIFTLICNEEKNSFWPEEVFANRKAHELGKAGTWLTQIVSFPLWVLFLDMPTPNKQSFSSQPGRRVWRTVFVQK